MVDEATELSSLSSLSKLSRLISDSDTTRPSASVTRAENTSIARFAQAGEADHRRSTLM